MKILQISPHYGGGIGTVVSGWIRNDKFNAHHTYFLELCKDRKVNSLFVQMDDIRHDMLGSDIILCHYWDNPMLADLFVDPIPDCRLVFWCHKNISYSEKEMRYPDLWINTSPIQKKLIKRTYLPIELGKTLQYKDSKEYIWSTGNMERFFKIQPKKHKGFNVGYVGTVDYKKLHPDFIDMCEAINIPDVHFTVIGENNIHGENDHRFTFTGKVDDVAPYLAEMDVFGYALRKDHYGTCEQVLGEAMAAGVVPVVMRNAAEKLIVKHIVTGMVAEDEQDYVGHIKFLYEHPNDRELMSLSAQYDAQKLYSIDTMVSCWNDVFEEMMSQPKRSRKELK
jgi:glycosyltransferase involved in cell wall biosynthesis